MKVLVVNAGSSSLKLRLLGDENTLLGSADLSADADGFDTGALTEAISRWPSPDVIGHRIVHGGTQFTGPTRITVVVEQQLQELTALAPLHQPKSLAGLAAVSAQLPDVPAIACFDTAFHATIPAAAATYAIPAQWRERYHIRRYGFHGLSHAYAFARGAELVGRPADKLRIVTCHLGAGASLCAVVGGRSVDTTMGFTPLEGLVMATRSGSVDPGLVLWLEEHEHLSPREVAIALEQQSGLLALGGTADMQEIVDRAAASDPRAQLALGVYIHRLAGSIAAMTTAAGGLDLLVFTGGVGEHSATVRSLVAQRLHWAGVGIDEDRNRSADGDCDISARSRDGSATGGGEADDTAVRVVVVEAREDIQIAREVRAIELAD